MGIEKIVTTCITNTILFFYFLPYLQYGDSNFLGNNGTFLPDCVTSLQKASLFVRLV